MRGHGTIIPAVWPVSGPVGGLDGLMGGVMSGCGELFWETEGPAGLQTDWMRGTFSAAGRRRAGTVGVQLGRVVRRPKGKRMARATGRVLVGGVDWGGW
jgi:hypothetical protein